MVDIIGNEIKIFYNIYKLNHAKNYYVQNPYKNIEIVNNTRAFQTNKDILIIFLNIYLCFK